MDGRWVMLHRWGLRRGRDSDCALVARSEKRQQKYPEKPWTMTGSLVAPWLVTSFITHCCGIAYNFSSSNQVWLCWSHWHEQHAQTDPTRSLVPDQTKYLEIATGLQNVSLYWDYRQWWQALFFKWVRSDPTPSYCLHQKLLLYCCSNYHDVSSPV